MNIIFLGDDKYQFSLDQRMKNFLNPIHDFRYAVESLENDPITCPTLMLLAKQYVSQNELMQPVIKTLEKCRNVHLHYIDGGHDVHNTNPEVIAPYVNKFLIGMNSNKL